MPHTSRVVLAALLGFTLALRCQSPVPASSPEMTSREEAPTFRTSTNVVLVPVVVRDSKGQPVGDLRQEDFQVFDRGKQQVISRFSLEKRETPGSLSPAPVSLEAGGAPTPIPPSAAPKHFFAYLFDDIHSQQADLQRVRDAAAVHRDSESRS